MAISVRLVPVIDAVLSRVKYAAGTVTHYSQLYEDSVLVLG
jgi:hypothetical protein